MSWDQVFAVLRAIHITGGSIALITGYSALVVTRGGPRHRQLGRVYVWGMVAVALTALPMAIIKPNPFLFGVAVFSSYFLYSGRAAAVKRDGTISSLDYTAAFVLLITSVSALAASTYIKLNEIPYSETFLITGSVFALIGLVIAFVDLRRFRKGPINGRGRIIKHLTGMCAALIATTTAVAVTMSNVVPEIPKLVAWLGPTAVMVPVIIYWVRQVRLGSFKF